MHSQKRSCEHLQLEKISVVSGTVSAELRLNRRVEKKFPCFTPALCNTFLSTVQFEVNIKLQVEVKLSLCLTKYHIMRMYKLLN
jgi:hypothetical protein